MFSAVGSIVRIAASFACYKHLVILFGESHRFERALSLSFSAISPPLKAEHDRKRSCYEQAGNMVLR